LTTLYYILWILRALWTITTTFNILWQVNHLSLLLCLLNPCWFTPYSCINSSYNCFLRLLLVIIPYWSFLWSIFKCFSVNDDDFVFTMLIWVWSCWFLTLAIDWAYYVFRLYGLVVTFIIILWVLLWFLGIDLRFLFQFIL